MSLYDDVHREAVHDWLDEREPPERPSAAELRDDEPNRPAVFMDGTGITPGTEKCGCGPNCEFPCWQRLGWAPACRECGCPPFEEE
jgi:hypothetical protein